MRNEDNVLEYLLEWKRRQVERIKALGPEAEEAYHELCRREAARLVVDWVEAHELDVFLDENGQWCVRLPASGSFESEETEEEDASEE
jgi:hypothetical protein